MPKRTTPRSLGLAADGNRFAAQRRIQLLLNRAEKGVQIKVEDLACLRHYFMATHHMTFNHLGIRLIVDSIESIFYISTYIFVS